MTIRPHDYRELADLARKLGFQLCSTASTSERFVMHRRGDQAIACTFTDLDGVRAWLA